MIKKRIPDKYDLENIDIVSIVQNVLGNVPISFGSNRVLKIDAEPTTEEMQQIKADFLAVAEEITEL